MRKRGWILAVSAFALTGGYFLFFAHPSTKPCISEIKKEQARQIFADEMYKFPAVNNHKSRQRFDEELKTAEWEIYDIEPLPEAEEQSEYDLVRYEIRMQIGLAHYEADLGSCGEVLNSAAYNTDKAGVIK